MFNPAREFENYSVISKIQGTKTADTVIDVNDMIRAKRTLQIFTVSHTNEEMKLIKLKLIKLEIIAYTLN